MPLGIPHSVLTGRVVRPGLDRQWSDYDLDIALSYLAQKAEECNRCGTRRDEWAADPDAYVVGDYVCEGCGRLDDEEQNIPDGKEEARYYTRGKHTHLVPGYIKVAQDIGEQP